MSVIDTVRPVSVYDAGAGTAVPSGTLATVTADNSDATYIDFNVADHSDDWVLRVASHTPSAGYGRHRVRGRIRIRADAGSCTEDVCLGRGAVHYYRWTTVPVTTSFAEQISDWFQDSEFGLAVTGALADLNISGGWPESVSGAAELRTSECYVDVDCRLWPDYAPEVRDASGTDQAGGTVTDTNQPTLYFGSPAYDGLPALDWAVVVRDAGAVAVFTASGSGSPPSTVPVSVGLDDGAYTADFTVQSSIRLGDPFPHEQSLSFAVNNLVTPPSPPLLDVTEEAGGYRVTWSDPGGPAWDDDYVVAEVWRNDCTGTYRIAVTPDSLNGSYLDLAIPQVDLEPGCDEPIASCNITYSVRYWGYITSGTPPLPELRTTDYSSEVVPSFSYTDGLDRLSSMDDRMALTLSRSS
ncbi:MAG TPA: hypothetical protein VFT95_21620, partial [Micromonosporaceae bacterium]|nr:hypothetical protein [Micromonosporaceae bacterium]